MSINYNIVKQVRDKLTDELPSEYAYLIDNYDEAIAKPNFRAAFMVLMDVTKLKEWKPSEELNQLIGKFWHEVAE